MTPSEALQKLMATLAEVDEDLSRKPPDAFAGKHLGEELGLDSLDVLKFVLLVEERFGCKLPDEDIDQHELLKLDRLAAYLSERASG